MSMEKLLAQIASHDIVKILKDKLEVEKLTKFFDLDTYEFKGDTLALDGSNSLLLRFETLQKDFPDEYKGFAFYKLLLILDFRDSDETAFDINLQNDLLNITHNDGVNKIVIWSVNPLHPRIIRVLKEQKTDILYIGEDEISKIRFIPNFFPHSSGNYDYAVVLNKVSELLLKRLKKLFHLVLSEIAAPIYNRRYGKAKVATKSMMEFEERLVWGLAQRLKEQNRAALAIDVGCGTGRHTFKLAEVFATTYGFDISPKMVDEAEKEKSDSSRIYNRVIFSVSDLEYEELINERSLDNNVDLIVASFGMGSFIEDTTRMLKRFHDWLRPGGYIFLSFYNSNSIVLQITPSWRDTSLSAHIDVENKTLQVELTPDIVFRIYCKPFNDELKSEIKGLFDIERLSTYPTLMALLPNHMLAKQSAQKLFSHVDIQLSKGSEYNTLGHYVLIVGKKPGYSLTGHRDILEILTSKASIYELLEHPPVLSIRDVIEAIGLDLRFMIKTVLFSYRQDKKKFLVSVALRAQKQVDKAKLAEIIGINPNILRFATEKQITQLGFPIGGIAPFGFKENIDTRNFIDDSISTIEAEWLYMGSGDNTKTLKIKKSSFLEITEAYERITL